MKNATLLKVLCVFALVLTMLIFAVACNQTPDTDNGEPGTNTPSTPDDNQQGNQTVDRTNPEAGTYRISFYLGETETVLVHYYNEGETITPPKALPAYTDGATTVSFDGWDGVTFATVTGDATYRSNVIITGNTYKVTFVVGNETKEVTASVGNAPEVPDISEFTLAEGVKFCAWDRAIDAFDKDTTVYAVLTKYFDTEYFLGAFQRGPIAFSSLLTENDNSNSTTDKASALVALLVEENYNPQSGAVANRIVEHLTSVVSKDQAPAFDACCYWSYSILSGAIAMAKATPTVWELVPDDIKLRLDVMMRAFAYLESFATSDSNDYKTGPSMKGNYSKTWNPNYRLANIPVMIYVTHYFGNGDMEDGCTTVNTYLKGFNEAEYEDMINLFQKYGWRRALLTWTAEGRVANDGSIGLSAKEVMVNGGPAVGDDTSTASDLQVPLGNGSGVSNGGKDYRYGGHPLNAPEKIVLSLLLNNYGDDKGNFLEVKSNHFYDITGDGNPDLVAWIMGENDTSPYEGQYGMMREFASGNRSSTSYCSHDFVLTTSMIISCKVLGIYDITTDTYSDKNGVNIREAVLVGNEDFLFKNEQGYQGYATGSYGVSTSSHSEKTEGKGYFALKSLWRNILKPAIEEVIYQGEA